MIKYMHYKVVARHKSNDYKKEVILNGSFEWSTGWSMDRANAVVRNVVNPVLNCMTDYEAREVSVAWERNDL